MLVFCIFTASLVADIVAVRSRTAADSPGTIASVVARAVGPLMKRYGIPGMAVGVTIDGRHDVFDYGVMSKATGRRVEASTLFEIGSVTKTFTATLASYAAETGHLALSDTVGADLPSLRGTSFDRVRLSNLGTHTAGGLPLQFPDDVRTDVDAMRYYRHWKPAHDSGTYRLYSNPSIMLLGVIASSRLGDSFPSSMQRFVLDPLGLRDTFLTVPPGKMSHYAQGYTDEGKPRRMFPGPLAAEAYGIRTTADDVLRFIDANLDVLPVDAPLRRAIDKTHEGYYQIGPMTQDLIWEQYRYPTPLSSLLQGNSERMIFDDNRVRAIDPPSKATRDVTLDKTGSTSGFAAYVAFVPSRRIGLVMLANKSYPIEARVRAAYEILAHL